MLSSFRSKIRILTLSGAGSTLLLLSGCSVTPTQYLERGIKAFDAGDYAEARIDFEKAIQKDPNLGEAYFRIGRLQLREAEAGEAFRNLSTATQLMPDREDVLVAVGDAALATYLLNHHATSFYDELSTVAAKLVKTNPQGYDALRLTGYIKMIDRNFPEAVDYLRKADAAKPMQPETTHALVQCLFENGQGPEAEKTANALIRSKKDFPAVYDTLYRYYVKENRPADAESILKTKIANNPSSIAYRLELATHYSRVGNEPALNATIQELKSSGSFPDAYMNIGNFYASISRPAPALQEFEAGAKQDSKHKIDYQRRIAEILLRQGKRDEAQAVVEDILKAEPTDFTTRMMRAGINIDSGDQSRLTKGMTELQALVRERPADATTRFNLGKARLINGDVNGALTDFKEALRIDPQLMQARLLAANTSLQAEDFTGAARYADEILEVAGNNPTARMLKIQSLAGLGNYSEATSEAARLDRDFPGSAGPKMELANLALAQKKYSDADARYRAIYAADHANIRALQGVVDVYFAQNQQDAALQYLTAESKKGDSPQVRIVLADAALRAQKGDLAVQQYTLLVKANPKSSFGHMRLGDSYLTAGKHDEAIQEFQVARGLAPKDPLITSMLALSLHDAGRAQEAQKTYRDALALQSGNPLVMNNLAYLMAETGGDLDEALRLAQDASRRQPSNPGLSDTVGWIYLKKNLTDSAIQILGNVVQKDPRQPVYRYHYGSALFQKGDKAGAKRELLAALSNKPNDKDQQKIATLLAQIH